MVAWVNSQAAADEWTQEAAAWATPAAGNSTQSTSQSAP